MPVDLYQKKVLELDLMQMDRQLLGRQLKNIYIIRIRNLSQRYYVTY